MKRVTVTKTYKLFIGGGFPRSESGRSIAVETPDERVVAHIAWASRKDLRDAIDIATRAQPAWGERSAYNRGQILYRMAEMMEGKVTEFVDALRATDDELTAAQAKREVTTAIDRMVSFAGWTDKFAAILGSRNPVAGPYYNFSDIEPTGVVAVVVPDTPPLLALVTLLAPPLCAGNTVVAIAEAVHPLAAAIFGEVCATSDVPAGVVNVLTGHREELAEHLAAHRGLEAISGASLPKPIARTLRAGTAENVKRVLVTDVEDDEWYDHGAMNSPWAIEPFVEVKTIWHSSAM